MVDTVRCCYNAVNFLTNINKRHPIAHPLGRAMGCLLWIRHLIDILPQFLQLQCIYVISYYMYIGPRYNGTWLWPQSSINKAPLLHLFNTDQLSWYNFKKDYEIVTLSYFLEEILSHLRFGHLRIVQSWNILSWWELYHWPCEEKVTAKKRNWHWINFKIQT